MAKRLLDEKLPHKFRVWWSYNPNDTLYPYSVIVQMASDDKQEAIASAIRYVKKRRGISIVFVDEDRVEKIPV